MFRVSTIISAGGGGGGGVCVCVCVCVCVNKVIIVLNRNYKCNCVESRCLQLGCTAT